MATRELCHAASRALHLHNPSLFQWNLHKVAPKLFSISHFSDMSTHGCCFTSFSSQSLCSLSDSASPDLVNELSRVLSDYRSPHHDVESALTPFSSDICTDLVEQVLKRCKNLGFSAHRFFIWAHKLPGFEHSEESYHILVDILGSSRQFPLIWDFLVEVRQIRSHIISPKVFWIVFRAYSRANLPGDAIRAFNKMVDFGLIPSHNDLDQLLLSLCERKHVRQAYLFFDKIKKDYVPNAKTYSILMRGWGEISESGEAQKLFDEMLSRGCSIDLLAYNTILSCLCKSGRVDEAYNLFKRMRSLGLEPDAYTYSIFIHNYCEANNLYSAFSLLSRMRKYKLVPNVYTYNVIIKKLCNSDKVEEAYELLGEMIEQGARPNIWSYNTILAFHCDRNEVNRALMLISRMCRDGCQPDKHTYNMVLKMLLRVGRFDRVEKVWADMEDNRFYPSVSTYAVMVHGYCGKKGKLEEACKYFEIMIDEGIPPHSETCELLRSKLIRFGFADQTEILADKMERSSSCAVQELSHLMRGNKVPAKPTYQGEFSDESGE